MLCASRGSTTTASAAAVGAHTGQSAQNFDGRKEKSTTTLYKYTQSHTHTQSLSLNNCTNYIKHCSTNCTQMIGTVFRFHSNI